MSVALFHRRGFRGFNANRKIESNASNRSAITLADRRGSLLPRHRGVKFDATKGAEPEVARKRELPAGPTEHRSNSFLNIEGNGHEQDKPRPNQL